MKNQKVTDLVPTESFKEAHRIIKQAVTQNKMAAIIGYPGVGKTTLKEISMGRYRESEKYLVIDVPAGYTETNETGSIVTQMITQMGEKPKRKTVDQMSQLTVILKEITIEKRIILSIDEAQDLTKKTIFGIKKINELGRTHKSGNLFSTILFGKPQLKTHLDEYEVGYRIPVYKMSPMTEDEIGKLLESRGIEFKNQGMVKKFWDDSARGVPLIALRKMEDIKKIQKSRKMTADQALSYLISGDLNEQALSLGITNNEIAKYLYKKTGQNVDKSTIHKANTGKLNSDLANAIRQTTEELIQKTQKG